MISDTNCFLLIIQSYYEKRLLIIVSILYCLAISGQDNLSGNYYNEAGVCLNIKQDRFKLIMPNAARNGYYSDIIAEGDLKYIDKSFVELNSMEVKGCKI